MKSIFGDVSLKKRAEPGFERALVRVEDYLREAVFALMAEAPEDEDYCWGGCPGALEKPSKSYVYLTPRPMKKCPVHIVLAITWPDSSQGRGN